jgi:hypothetical protein
LFINILSAASCGHPLQVIVTPRGALTWRLRVLIGLMCVEMPASARARRVTFADVRTEGSKSKNVRARCQFEIEKFLT